MGCKFWNPFRRKEVPSPSASDAPVIRINRRLPHCWHRYKGEERCCYCGCKQLDDRYIQGHGRYVTQKVMLDDNDLCSFHLKEI